MVILVPIPRDTPDNPETDGQTERVNRVLEKILRGYVQSFTDWINFLPMVGFAINNSVYASTTHIPLFVNDLRHPRLPAHLGCDSGSRGEEFTREKGVLDLAHHASNYSTTRTLPMLIKSTSKNITSAIVTTLLQTQMRMTMLVYSASPMNSPARMKTPSLKKRMTS